MVELRPPRSFSNVFFRHYYERLKDTTVWSDADPTRLQYLRCSALPFCPLDFFAKVATNGMARSLDMNGVFYTRVGTAVHDVMQTVLAYGNTHLFGDWKCHKCGALEHFSTARTCCGWPMAYQEVTVNYGGINGHVDTLFALNPAAAAEVSLLPEAERMEAAKSLELVIVDYKTTSESAKEDKKRSPPLTYQSQIKAYAWLLRKQYGLNIQGVMLVFIPRDNPAKPTIWEYVLTDTDYKLILQDLRLWKAAHKAALNIASLEDVAALYENFGTCTDQYCDTCKAKDVKAVLKQAYMAGAQSDRLPLTHFIEQHTTADDN
jgi:hypothetical protein